MLLKFIGMMMIATPFLAIFAITSAQFGFMPVLIVAAIMGLATLWMSIGIALASR